MKKINILAVSSLLGIFSFSGCVNPGVVRTAPDTYMVSKIGAGVFSNMASLKADIFRQANDFATSQGKIAIPLTVNETPFTYGRNPSVELKFRVVDANDPEARRVTLEKRPDITIKKEEKITADIKTKVEGRAPGDLYTALMKLDDLKKRGIITEEEFQAQKTKLLSENK